MTSVFSKQLLLHFLTSVKMRTVLQTENCLPLTTPSQDMCCLSCSHVSPIGSHTCYMALFNEEYVRSTFLYRTPYADLRSYFST